MKAFICLLALVAAVSALDLSNVRPASDLLAGKARDPVLKALLTEEVNRQGRITNGRIAFPGQFPHQVALFVNAAAGTFFCGGSLLDAQTVLTAAHCVDEAISVDVIAGAQNVRENEPSQERINAPRSNVVFHEQWNVRGNLENDVAVINLPRAFPLNERIQPIGRLRRSDVGVDQFAGEFAITSGWGKPSDTASGISDELRWVETEVKTNAACKTWYGATITDGHVCNSGTGGKSSCNGDSGGPLTVKTEDGETRQLGIVSFGIALGCSIGFPHAYTRVPAYFDWITANTNGRIVFN